MIYLDTGIIVRALLADHPQHTECFRLISRQAFSSCHTLAETFNTLTGFFKVQNGDAADLIDSLIGQVEFKDIQESDYLRIIRQSRQRGIQGGLIYDAIHAHVARTLNAEKIVTYNLTNFRHVAPDILIEAP